MKLQTRPKGSSNAPRRERARIMRSVFVLLLAANAAKCKKKTRDLGFRKEIDKLGLMKCAECPIGSTGR